MEIDPDGKQAHELGAKLDAGKACPFQGLLAYFPRACELVATVSTFGATKYTWKGWETVPRGFERYSDAMVRHLIKEGQNEFKDQDSGLPHAAHTAWNALARLELLLREKENQNKNLAHWVEVDPSAKGNNDFSGPDKNNFVKTSWVNLFSPYHHEK